MAGTVTPIKGIFPEHKPDQVVSWESSRLFAGSKSPRYNPDDLVGRKGLRIYKQMLNDEQVKAVVQFKRDAILSRGWQLVWPAGSGLSPEEQAARSDTLTAILRAMRGAFEDALNAIALGRVFGYSLTEKVYSAVTLGGRQWVGVNVLLKRDPEQFEFYCDEYGTLQRVVQKVGGAEQEVDLGKFVHYVHAPEHDPYLGRSDLREAHRSWYIKDAVSKLWPMYLEKFGGGLHVARISADSTLRHGSTEYAALEDALSDTRSLSSLILPPGVEYTVHFPATTDGFERCIVFHDLAIAKALLVPNLLGISHTGQTGAYSQSQTQLEAFFWTLNADARRLEATLNEQLFRDLAQQNWGDEEYPEFRFKPPSEDHVRWVIGTWRELVAARAVTPTESDEKHLRSLLEMPAATAEDEGEDAALKSDSSAAFAGVQVTALLEVLRAVALGDIPKASAALLIQQAYPVSLAEAQALVAPIVEGSIQKPAAVPNAPPANKDASGDTGAPPASTDDDEEDEDTEDNTRRAAFTRAVQRVDFAVIGQRTERLAQDVVTPLAAQLAKAVQRTLGDDAHLRELLDEDVADIGQLALGGTDVGKIKGLFNSMLTEAWRIGQVMAQNELEKARKEHFTRERFANLRDVAVAYFEANAFRMAGNLSDGARSIIQQELQNGIKGGYAIPQVRAHIWERLLDKGFTTAAAVKGAELDAETLELLQEKLLEQLAPAYLNTLVRTNTFEALNEARYSLYSDPELADFVQALEYSAILDERTTDICSAMDGRVYRADHEVWDDYRPPLHWNCRSVLVAITAVDGWDGHEDGPPSVAPQDGFGGGA